MNPAVPAPPGTAPAVVAPAVADEEIRIYGHSNLFYWWPVWALGFLFALLTYIDGHVMAVVPAGTQVEQGQVLPGRDGQPRDVLVAPAGQAVPAAPGATEGLAVLSKCTVYMPTHAPVQSRSRSGRDCTTVQLDRPALSSPGSGSIENALP